MTDAPPAAARASLGPPPVEVRGLAKRYGELTAVAGVDLTVHAGDVYGYLGPNGAGKTTCLRMMLGLIRPTEGTVRLFGRDPLESVHALDGVAGFVEASVGNTTGAGATPGATVKVSTLKTPAKSPMPSSTSNNNATSSKSSAHIRTRSSSASSSNGCAPCKGVPI